MRTSQAESIRKPLEQAIKALNDFFEHEEKSEESAADFEKEYQRLAALPEGTAPATKLETLTRNQLEQDVTAMLGPAPRNNPAKKKKKGIESNPGINYEEAIKNYLARKKALLLPHITHPRIKDYYPWQHCVAEAAGHLAECGWTTEAKAIVMELRGLPKDNGSIDWTQPGTRQEIRTKVFEVANSIRDILTACLRGLVKVRRASTEPKPNEISQPATPAAMADVEKSRQEALLAGLSPKNRHYVFCGRIWSEYRRQQDALILEGGRPRTREGVQIVEAFPTAKANGWPEDQLDEFVKFAKEGIKKGKPWTDFVKGSKGKEILLKKFLT